MQNDKITDHACQLQSYPFAEDDEIETNPSLFTFKVYKIEITTAYLKNLKEKVALA